MTIVKDKYVAEDGVSTLSRPRYTPGLLLEDDDLTAAVEYTRNMMRLMFRSLFGCGVICGLDVTAQLTCNRRKVEVTVGKGVALDCLGNPIEIPKSVKVVFDADCDTPPEWLWVVVCYVEKCCRPKDISCAPDEHGQIVQTRIMDGFEVRLYPNRPKCACSCEPPAEGTTTSRSDCCDDDEDEMAAAPAQGQVSGLKQQSAMTAKKKIDAGVLLGDPGDVLTPGSDRYNDLLNRQRDTSTTQGQPTSEPPKLPDLCDCYQDHYEGKCDCTCCCPCVLVGKVTTRIRDDRKAVDLDASDPQGLAVDRRWVRWIRPVLTGYYKCIKAVQTIAGGQIVAGQQRPNAGGQKLRA
jgi:hypothetical protein